MPERWTTQDELATVRSLLEKKDLHRLVNYLNAARQRQWHGDGMNVDPRQVIWAAEDAIKRLKGCKSVQL